MSHKNKQKTFFISSIIFLLLGCTQKPVDIVSPTQPNIILETPIPNRNPTPTITSQPQVAQEDTGYEGYYTGIVVITEYYTLLNNELLEEAYERLSISEQNENSLKEFIQLNEGVTSEIVTIKPLVIWQIEQGISPFIKDKEGRIG
ncbi:MAG TPA: hypothetical protein PLX90_03065, partial [Anaerolineales bacterium]|nr:hypothetical protein [Anaerolineales bacterium]